MNEPRERREKMTLTFQKRFGALPELWARAPGRVDLMGSHTDYNLGRVLTLPIGRDVWLAVRRRSDATVRVLSLNCDAESTFDLRSISHAATEPWGNYLRGVAWALREEGLEPTAFDGVLHGTVPIGSGLSSSAALECATAVVFRELGGWRLGPVDMALLCQRAENRFVGVNCGILDQYTSCMGEEGCALLLDCRDLSSRPVRLAAGIRVVICDTRSSRELTGSEYGQRRAQCEEGARLLGVQALREVSLERFSRERASLPPEVERRSRFILEEDDRVVGLSSALESDDRGTIRDLTRRSYLGARDLYEIGAPAMEAMMEAMRQAPGCIGARQAGAGFGGCMVAFVEASSTEAFAASVSGHYRGATGIEPEVYCVRAAAGAGTLS